MPEPEALSALVATATSPGAVGDAVTRGAHRRAGSGVVHSVSPFELEEQVPFGLSTQSKSAGQSAVVLHAVSTTTHANVPVRVQLTSLLGASPELGS